MLKVMLLNDGEGRAASLRQTLAAAGVHVVAEVAPGADLAASIAQSAADVVLIDSDAASAAARTRHAKPETAGRSRPRSRRNEPMAGQRLTRCQISYGYMK